jgi:chromosome segregation ATPase
MSVALRRKARKAVISEMTDLVTYQKAQERIEELEAEAASLQAELDANEVAQAQVRVEELRADLAGLRADLKSLSDDLHWKRITTSEHKDRVAEIELEVKATYCRLRQAQETLAERRGRVRLVEHRLEVITSELGSLRELAKPEPDALAVLGEALR